MQTQQILDPLSQPRRSNAVRLMMDGSSRWVHGDDLDPGTFRGSAGLDEHPRSRSGPTRVATVNQRPQDSRQVGQVVGAKNAGLLLDRDHRRVTIRAAAG